MGVSSSDLERKALRYIATIAIISIAAAGLFGCADAATITVRPGESIQAAIGGAMPGDTIEVHSGVYLGLVAVTKRLHLIGVDTGEGRPVIDAGGMGSPITLWVGGSILEGFEARNSGLSELEAGIKIASGNITVKDCSITRCNLGIRMQSSDGSTVEGNDLKDNQRGIMAFQSDQNMIKGNILGGNVYGIMIWNSWGNEVRSNEIWTSQQMGIYLVSSQENNISENQLASNSNGISLVLSPANTISDNVLYMNSDHGIHLKRSGQNTLRNNQLEANTNGFYVEGQEYPDFWNNIDSSNLINGKPIIYLVGGRDAVVDSSSRAGTVFCMSCRNVTIKDLIIEGSDVGIHLLQTRDSTVENNTVRDNKQYGIELYESYGNLVNRNNITRNNKSGIYLENSSLNVIKGNNVFRNAAGIMLSDSCKGNAFYLNNLALNGEYDAVDEGANLWSLGDWGNYYQDFNCTDSNSDSICDSGRPIAGGKNVDDRPLAGPVSFEGQMLAPTARLGGETPPEIRSPELPSPEPSKIEPPRHVQKATWHEYEESSEIEEAEDYRLVRSSSPEVYPESPTEVPFEEWGITPKRALY